MQSNDVEVLGMVLDEDFIVPVLAIVCGTLIAIVAIIFSLVRSMVVRSAREQTKRELAAYVAEGTLDADKAVALIKADQGADQSGCGG